MHIAILWDYFGPYHTARVRGLRELASKEAFRLTAIEMAGRSATYAWSRVQDTGADITLFPNAVSESVGSFKLFFVLRRRLRVCGPDVLMVPSYWPSYALTAAVVARTLGIRVVVMADSHYASGSNTGLPLLVKRFLMRLYGAAFVAGSAQRSFFRYLGMPDDRIFDGYDVVDNAYFANAAARVRGAEAAWRLKLGLPDRYILSLGRLVAKKNLSVIVQAYRFLQNTGRSAGVHLVFVGSGGERDSLVRLCRTLGLPVVEHSEDTTTLEERRLDFAVHFFPFAQVEHTPAYYALADCFVIASLSEEWGLVVNEAMACGCPVIASRHVGCSYDLVKSGQTGYLFYPDNVEELAWVLGEAMSAPVLLREKGRVARELVIHWGPERFARHALLAAKQAMVLVKTEAAVSACPELVEIILLQTAFPDYRLPVYKGLREHFGSGFRVFTGMSYFTPDVRTCAEFHDWVHIVRNHFIVGRKLLSQHEVLPELLSAEVVILELNPRILTNWVILGLRWLWNRPTLVWGHAWSRSGSVTFRNVFRLMMAQLASGVVTYTKSQRNGLQSILTNQRIFSAPNSLLPQSEFSPDIVSPDQLEEIVYVGRLNPAKKPLLLLEAFILIAKELPARVVLTIIGEGLEKSVIEQRAEAAGLAPRVRLLGHISNREILRARYRRAFCAVSPGYVGLSAIQAFSFGVPMVIADKEDHAPEIEACEQGMNTVFFTSDNPSALAATLVLMWERRVEWAARREEIAQWTAARYSTDIMVDGLATAIETVGGEEFFKPRRVLP